MRVAQTPESVAQLIKKGFSVVVEKGAGVASQIPDAYYEDAGAKIVNRKEGKSVIDMIDEPEYALYTLYTLYTLYPLYTLYTQARCICHQAL